MGYANMLVGLPPWILQCNSQPFRPWCVTNLPIGRQCRSSLDGMAQCLEQVVFVGASGIALPRLGSARSDHPAYCPPKQLALHPLLWQLVQLVDPLRWPRQTHPWRQAPWHPCQVALAVLLVRQHCKDPCASCLECACWETSASAAGYLASTSRNTMRNIWYVWNIFDMLNRMTSNETLSLNQTSQYVRRHLKAIGKLIRGWSA